MRRGDEPALVAGVRRLNGYDGFFTAKKILITGATGFVGACLAHRLVALGGEVHCLTRAASNRWRLADIAGRITEHVADLTDHAGLEALIGEIKPRIVYHLAAYGGYPFQQDRERMLETNLKATVNLLHACACIGFEAFVNTGSSSEYGPKTAPMKETDLLEPVTAYGVTKSAATLYARFLGLRERLPVVTLRLFSPFGYYEEPTRLVPTVIKACLGGERPKLANGRAARDFIFIDDVIDVYCLIASRQGIQGEIFNVGLGVQHSVAQVAAKIIELTGAAVEPDWGSQDGRVYDSDLWVSDNTKLKAFLNWTPRYSLEEGLHRTIDWFRAHGGLYAI